jgi:hypothetical protein
MKKIRNFDEGHSTVEEWQGRSRVVAGSGRGTAWERHGNGMGTAWERHGNGMVCVNRHLTRQGNDRETAWERHDMCESAFKRQGSSPEVP